MQFSEIAAWVSSLSTSSERRSMVLPSNNLNLVVNWVWLKAQQSSDQTKIQITLTQALIPIAWENKRPNAQQSTVHGFPVSGEDPNHLEDSKGHHCANHQKQKYQILQSVAFWYWSHQGKHNVNKPWMEKCITHIEKTQSKIIFHSGCQFFMASGSLGSQHRAILIWALFSCYCGRTPSLPCGEER